jgi:hypothetical protein
MDTTTAKKSIDTLHFEHRLWINELKFAKDELTIYERRLEELVKKSDNKELMINLERFQNKFILQKEKVHDLMTDIQRHEVRLSDFAEAHRDNDDDLVFTDHDQIRIRMGMFKEISSELKKDFYEFMKNYR